VRSCYLTPGSKFGTLTHVEMTSTIIVSYAHLHVQGLMEKGAIGNNQMKMNLMEHTAY
jgi:hypothetical protein